MNNQHIQPGSVFSVFYYSWTYSSFIHCIIWYFLMWPLIGMSYVCYALMSTITSFTRSCHCSLHQSQPSIWVTWPAADQWEAVLHMWPGSWERSGPRLVICDLMPLVPGLTLPLFQVPQPSYQAYIKDHYLRENYARRQLLCSHVMLYFCKRSLIPW